MTLVRKPFVYLRHGETAYNRQHRICGSTDIPLTSLGEQQARQAALWLESHSGPVFCSALGRARRTAELALPQQQARVLAQLNERDFGELEGTLIPPSMDHFATPAGGESWIQFRERVVAGLNEALAATGLVAVVAHGGVYRVLYEQIFGTPDCQPLANATPMLIVPVGENLWQVIEVQEPLPDVLKQAGLS